ISRDPISNVVEVENVRKVAVYSMVDTLQVYSYASGCRCTAATSLNDTSSRSHGIFTIETLDRKFHFVDLAGSERLQSSIETRSINRSLSALGHVIASLTSAKKFKHIPFRNSKLTRVLENCLAPTAVCKTLLIVTVSPANEAYGESLSTLKFAQRAKSLRTAKLRDSLVQPNSSAVLSGSDAEIRRLERELASERTLRMQLEHKLQELLRRPQSIETLLNRQRDVLNSLFREGIENKTKDFPEQRKLEIEEKPVLKSSSVEALIARRRKQLESAKNSTTT
ncbi:nucleoside-triphosphatase, partial [Perkinsus sp. BL_2016]